MVDLKMLEEKTPILKEICSEKEVFWKNPDKTACGEAMEQIELGMEDVEDAERRLERFAPFIMKCFPETKEKNGIIESVLTPVPKMKDLLNEKYDSNLEGNLLLKQDSHLAIAGSIKARGGIYEIPDDVSFDAASLGEPLTSVFACLENVKVGYPDTLVIIGAGPIGCFMAQLAKIRGAQKVIMIDINGTRLEMAKDFGVDITVNSSEENPIEAVKKLTGGKGADKVISATPVNTTQTQSIHMVKKGGLVVFFGGVPKGSMTELDCNLIHYNNIWIKGHFGASYSQSKRAFQLAISPTFPTEKFITHTLPLDKINEGIGLTKSGKAIKVVLHPWD